MKEIENTEEEFFDDFEIYIHSDGEEFSIDRSENIDTEILIAILGDALEVAKELLHKEVKEAVENELMMQVKNKS